MDDEQLELMKQLLGIDVLFDNSKDTLLNHHLQKARDIILGYCRLDELPVQYDSVLVDYAIYLYKHRDSMGMLRKTEGERSAIYEEGIPHAIRLALPLPKIKVGY